MNNVNRLSHTSWNCKYHIVFAPKYRRKVFYGQKRREIGEILRTLCNWKKVNIIEAEVCPGHIHMLVEIPPKDSILSFMGDRKRKVHCYDGPHREEQVESFKSCSNQYHQGRGKQSGSIAAWMVFLLRR